MKGMSIAGLILGIFAIILFWIPIFNVISLICGIVGLVLSAKGRGAAKAADVSAGLGTAGLVLSIIGVVLGGIRFLTCTVCAGAFAAAGV